VDRLQVMLLPRIGPIRAGPACVRCAAGQTRAASNLAMRVAGTPTFLSTAEQQDFSAEPRAP
jgi:hypothetical protein